ncbi:MAG: DUF4177 domain-containing protein [Firmicutes bacterium]|nr:DUF4177 domain-containing protein [Bacillota bacterium]
MAQRYEYKVTTGSGEKLWDAGKRVEKEMNDMALEGWRAVSVDYFFDSTDMWHYCNVTFERGV